jgi:hypothetical protein
VCKRQEYVDVVEDVDASDVCGVADARRAIVMPEIESELFEALLAGPLQILPAPTCPILWSDMTYAARLHVCRITHQASILVNQKHVVFQKAQCVHLTQIA